MTDRELLNRIRVVSAELERLIEGAMSNSKYHTAAVLKRALAETSEAAVGLAWHVTD